MFKSRDGWVVAEYPTETRRIEMARATETTLKPKPRAKKSSSLGQRITEGLEQAIAWSNGENNRARVTLVDVPDIDIRGVRRKMGRSQA
jgi:hypothetical protein